MPDGTPTLGIPIPCRIFRALDRLAISMRKSEREKNKHNIEDNL